MDKKEIKLKHLTLEYVTVALHIADQNLSLEDFEHDLRTILAARTVLPGEVIKYFYSPFHWTFFVDGTDSPLKLIYPKYVWQSTRVGLCRKVNEQDRHNLVRHVMEKYSGVLNSRIKIYSSNGENLGGGGLDFR
ncbi:hypothetical protein HY449_03975 [Candidatus Pacearchaeota archaeon]|nr:hypothetical protein [Candidatus Pacearchaeota archaeon]